MPVADEIVNGETVEIRLEIKPEGNFSGTVYTPVSYTHLDVYKRQGQHQRQQGAAACGDADHHGDLHRQDAPSERNPQGNIDREMCIRDRRKTPCPCVSR